MKIIECPRDAMQGIDRFISTEKKVDYINQLLKVGFDTIDFGSFVSPKAVPQMRDTPAVIEQLNPDQSKSKLLAIVANLRGAQEACIFEQISYLGFPLSLSETFQQRNTNRSVKEAFETVREIQDLCLVKGKTLVVYLSMGFGNPYGDPYSPAFVTDFTRELDKIGIRIVSLADTIGSSSPELISDLFRQMVISYPQIEFGAHLHSTPSTADEKVAATLESGCQRMDGAILGFGGCPMAKDDLTGNIATEKIIFHTGWQRSGLDKAAFELSMKMATDVFR